MIGQRLHRIYRLQPELFGDLLLWRVIRLQRTKIHDQGPSLVGLMLSENEGMGEPPVQS